MLRDRLLVGALRAGKTHPCRPDGFPRELVGARADRLNEAQTLGPREELVAPQPRHHEHIRLGNPPREAVEVAHLEVTERRAAPRIFVREPIGRVREADRQGLRVRQGLHGGVGSGLEGTHCGEGPGAGPPVGLRFTPHGISPARDPHRLFHGESGSAERTHGRRLDFAPLKGNIIHGPPNRTAGRIVADLRSTKLRHV